VSSPSDSACMSSDSRPRHLPGGRGVGRAVLPRPGIRMRGVPSSKAPGRTAIRPRAVGPCHGGWNSAPPCSRPSAGRLKCGSAHGSASSWPKANMPIRLSSPWLGNGVPACGLSPSRYPCLRRDKAGYASCNQSCLGFSLHRKRRRPGVVSPWAGLRGRQPRFKG